MSIFLHSPIVAFTYFFILTSSLYAQVPTNWQLGPFIRADDVNPIITPNPDSLFFCPIRNKNVHWEIGATFNPGAVVSNGKICLLYRAEDGSNIGIGGYTSRLGFASSSDGIHFDRNPTPVLYPANDNQKAYEWPGGCEDPRIVQAEDGTYVVLYTQYNRKIAELAVATSPDLMTWTKYGYVFANAKGKKGKGSFGRKWTKSGSIVCRVENDRLIATKINGKYWMYWGEGTINIATSDDLISWQPILDSKGKPIPLVKPRLKRFDSALAESGPPAVITENGIVFLYNGKNGTSKSGDPNVPFGAYSGGQLLLDLSNPAKVLARSNDPFFKPERPFEKSGQYKNGTVFVEGLVRFNNKWFLYYGTADSFVGVASTP